MCILDAWSTLCMIDSSRAKVVIVPSRMRKLAWQWCYAGILETEAVPRFGTSSSAATNGHLAHFPFALWSYGCSRDRRGVSIINERDGVCESFCAKISKCCGWIIRRLTLTVFLQFLHILFFFLAVVFSHAFVSASSGVSFMSVDWLLHSPWARVRRSDKAIKKPSIVRCW